MYYDIFLIENNNKCNAKKENIHFRKKLEYTVSKKKLCEYIIFDIF